MFLKRLDNSSSNKLVKECIFTSLMKLMEIKNFSDITITEITKKAGVSRMAYYRNYTSKEDILTEYLDELFEKYLEEVEKITGINAYQFACRFFAYFREQKEFLRNINKAGLSVMILDRFDKYLQSIVEKVLSIQTQEEISLYQIHFWAGGLYKVLVAWIENDFQESNEELAYIIRKFSAS